MRTRIIHSALVFFAVAGAFALAVVVFAPIGGMRLMGLVGLACALAGMGVQLFALREADPHAFMVLRYRIRAAISALTQRRGVRRGVRARVATALPAAPIARAA